MALDVAAVVISASSKNQMPGRSPRHAAASTPPFTIGMSTVLPVRLSVIVIESSATSLSLAREAVHVRLPQLEPEPLVKPVGRFSRRPRRQLDASRPERGGVVESRSGERGGDPLALGVGIGDDVLDPRADPGRDRE